MRLHLLLRAALLTVVLSGTALDIFVSVGGSGVPGGPLLVEGGAELICGLSGALKKVNWFAEIFRKRGDHAWCKQQIAEKVKSAAEKLANEIDAFIALFESVHQDDKDMFCLATGNSVPNRRVSLPNDRLGGCAGHWKFNGNYNHSDVAEELNERITAFTGGRAGGVDWKQGTSSVFGSRLRNDAGCPLTQHKPSSAPRCGGKLDQYGTVYGGLWKIVGEGYGSCSENECSCSKHYAYDAKPKIYWIGADAENSLGRATLLKQLRENFSELGKGSEEGCMANPNAQSVTSTAQAVSRPDSGTQSDEGLERISDESGDGAHPSAGDPVTAGGAIANAHNDSRSAAKLLEGLAGTAHGRGDVTAGADEVGSSMGLVPHSAPHREMEQELALSLTSAGYCTKLDWLAAVAVLYAELVK
ncbi:hypothetical protein ERJ75_000075900 [Trypanosoma vivax]|nr:hypothetical protein ERJ75_000075900 [Trypanosoma vivax]